MKKFSVLLASAFLAACAASPTQSPQSAEVAAPRAIETPASTFAADIRRTAYGVPHIKAADYRGIGYGIGYVGAADNLCQIAERFVTVKGERARWFGPGEKDENLTSDIYHRRLIQTGELERLLGAPSGSIDRPSEDAMGLAAGYVAGFNRGVREKVAAGVSDPRCKGAGWVREITETDFWLHVLAGQVLIQAAGVAAAAPPRAGGISHAALDDPLIETTHLGSNAYGLGKEVTKSGRGMLLGNPHYPWDGQNRFYRIHLMIPDKLNVVGAGLVTSATVGVGHTEHFAWTHTVSTARRFGYFELTLDPADPTRYMHEGRSVPMSKMEVAVEVKDGASVRPVTRTLYASQFGPIVATETLPWSRERAYALRVMPAGLRTIDQYIDMWRAKSVRELARSLSKHQATGFNTTAVDADGEAFFGDMGMVPNVTDELAAQCATSPLAKKMWSETRIPVLDGSRAACEWGNSEDATAPGVFAPSQAPQLFRTDFVSQSNDSHWLTNPNAPLNGYPSIYGDERTPRTLRTRLGLDLLADRVAGADGLAGAKFDLATLQQTLFLNRNLGGELVRDDLVKLCRSAKSRIPAPACDALAGWDLRVNLDSRGAHLFHLFAEAGGIVLKPTFDPAKAVETPIGLDVANPKVLEALQKAVAQLTDLKIPFDATLGAVQNETRNGVAIPIHGGSQTVGAFNLIIPESLEAEKGWTSIRHGSSWIMTVEFTPKGPKSQGVLTYSQSTDPTSPWHSDQTELYSRKEWDDLRFTEAEVEAGTQSRMSISE